MAIGWNPDGIGSIACSGNGREAAPPLWLSAVFLCPSPDRDRSSGHPRGLGDRSLPDRRQRKCIGPRVQPLFCGRPEGAVLAPGPHLQPSPAVFRGQAKRQPPARRFEAVGERLPELAGTVGPDAERIGEPIGWRESNAFVDADPLGGADPISHTLRIPVANTHAIGDANSNANAHTHSNSDAHTHSNSDAHTHSNSDTYPHAYSDSDTDPNSDTYPHAYANPHAPEDHERVRDPDLLGQPFRQVQEWHRQREGKPHHEWRGRHGDLPVAAFR